MALLPLHACATARTSATEMLSAQALWTAALRAHDGGHHVGRLSFFTEDALVPAGMVEFYYPEIAPAWRAYNLFDFGSTQRSLQVTPANGRVFSWFWDGHGMHTDVDGERYRPFLGIPREQHLKVNRWLVWPAHAMLGEDAAVARLSSSEGRPRLEFRFRQPPHEVVILHLDPVTLHVVRVDYTARSVRLPGVLRGNLEDLRDIGGGIMVAHRVVEDVEVPGGSVVFHDVTLVNVVAQLVPGYPPPVPPL